MLGYCDIHSHILPMVDDGAKDIEETLRMLSIAYKEGIRLIIATPHFTLFNHNVRKEKIVERYEQVKGLAEQHFNDLQIVLGNEIFYSSEIVEALRQERALTIDHTRYILVEFIPDVTFKELREGLYQCILSGFIPILAHVERYRCLLKQSVLVGELIELGVYIQLNTYNILGRVRNPKVSFCHKLLKRSWVHFLGTDAHDSIDRPPHMKEAAEYIQKKYGEERVRQLLWENPMTMLEERHLQNIL